MNLEPTPSHFSICNCHSHTLFTEYDKKDDSFYISLFNRGFNGDKFSFRQRLYWCWYILTKGKPFTDMVVIDSDKARSLAAFLKEHAESFKSDAK